MTKIQTVQTPISYKLSEFVVPTIIAFAIISSMILVYYAMTEQTKPSDLSAQVSQNTDTFSSQVIKEGTGEGAKVGDKVQVYYTGTLKDGSVFDASELHKNADGSMTPLTLTLGAGEVIVGWDQGLVGMKVGEIRKLTVPPSMGYGSQTVGSIPADSTLIFEVEMVKIGE